ncbi:MAG TPA: vWA domain-containing protein [Alphaproteobacteria bacterium]|nr:vWA domain-containing protein [Alphaproteobacteria bacterium]
MMRKRRTEIQAFSLSFLDVISCGFGAIILLLVITLAFEPKTIERITSGLRELVSQSAAAREQLIAEHRALSRELDSKQRELAQLQARVAALGSDWERVRRQQTAAQASAEASERIEEQLHSVRQSLSEEMKRLLSQPDYKPPGEDAPIGGIPIDSEYIIFVIDTSGSMQQGAWPLVVRKMQEVLNTYPQVKGIQVLNDQGTYMFPTYSGQWIPDTPARRTVVIDRLRTWNIFSASNPAPGIVQAIQTFYRPDRPTSIFVFGDDFNGPSIDEVVYAVARLNTRDPAGRSQVRIHTFGFPVLTLLAPSQYQANFSRFAHLMRLLAEQNSGSFVGLNALK